MWEWGNKEVYKVMLLKFLLQGEEVLVVFNNFLYFYYNYFRKFFF